MAGVAHSQTSSRAADGIGYNQAPEAIEEKLRRRDFIIGSAAAVGTGLLLVPAVLVPASRAYRDVNTHRDFATCQCGAKTWEQHAPDCPRGAVPKGEEQFYENLRHRLIEIVKRDGKSIERLVVEPEHDGYRFVRAWVEGESRPYTWNQPCE